MPAPNAMPTYDADVHDFFWDVPWGNIPAHRVGVITIDPPCYRGGLKGGSSKLAALAAKRRKEREDASVAGKAAAASTTDGDADQALAMLDKLTVTGKENKTPSPLSGEADVGRRGPRYPTRRRSPSPPKESPREAIVETEAPQPAVVVESPAQRASPSTFASTLCGTSMSSPLGVQVLPAPYAHGNPKDSLKAFEGPSPDDIVRIAQARGAGGGRR
jgi:elongation factor 1 alpha-like protein